MIRIKFKVGRSQVEFEGNDLKSIMKFSGLLGGLPSVCDNCKKDNLYLSHKNPKGNDYYFIACKDCGATLNFHERKEGGFYLVADEKMEVYKSDKPNNETKDEKSDSVEDDNDVPF